MSDAFDLCLAFTLKEEGPFSDRADDPGGATCRGITLATLVAWRKAKDEPTPTVDDLRNISDGECDAIYAMEFFNPMRCHDLPRGVDLMVFDFGVNAGPKRATVMLQRALGFTGTDVDGWVGVKTLAAAARADVPKLLAELAFLQQSFYFAEPNYVTFGHGWILRCNRRLVAAAMMAQAATAPVTQAG